MSSITDIVDQIYSNIATNFSTKSELFDPYDILNNDEQRLENGYGVVVGPASNQASTDNVFEVVNREVGVILSRVLFETDYDSSVRKSYEKQLLEDGLSITQDLYADVDLSGMLSSIKFVADSGIDYVVLGEDERRYIFTALTFTIKYRETLSLNS